MNFDLDDDQLMFERTIERFVVGAPGAIRDAIPSNRGDDAARWGQLAALGLLALPASPERGGLDGRPEDLVVAAMALGRGLARDPWLEAAHFPLRLLEGLPGTTELSEHIATGKLRVAVAFAEPHGRYSLVPHEVRATGQAGGWRVSGSKGFVMAGAPAQTFLVTAASPEGPCLVAVEQDAVEIRTHRIVDGSMAATLTFRDSPARWLGPLEPALADAVAATRLAACGELVGLASRLLDETLGYTRERAQFGRPLASFQAIQHRLVDCFASLEQARSMLWRVTLAERDPAGRWMAAIAGAKAFIAERAIAIGHEAIQLHGGMGMSNELSIGHAHKRIILLARLFGDPASDYATLLRAA